jgi:hypothetical protein
LALGLTIVKPETVVAWHRAAFRLFWTWKVRHRQRGRPVVSCEVFAQLPRYLLRGRDADSGELQAG